MRFLHTMLRVGDLDRSIKFYTETLGMKLLRKHDNEEYKYTLAFVGYADESEQAVIELTYNWGTDNYDQGTAFGHIALGADDIYTTCETIRKAGGKITREPGPVLGGSTEIAIVGANVPVYTSRTDTGVTDGQRNSLRIHTLQ